jgi:predicted nicotinamide N-methyase
VRLRPRAATPHSSLLSHPMPCRRVLRLQQDPNSQHLGTTVWDSSIVLAKFLEANCRKGDFAKTRVKGKRVLELGAGMGLGGIAFSLLGASVVLTDVAEVIPLLKRNVELNLGCSCPDVTVMELDWFKPEQLEALTPSPPFDYVIAADCVYAEHIIPHFHSIVQAATNDKSIVLVVNELRSHLIQAKFIEVFEATHTIKQISANKQDPKFQHELIQMFFMKRKRAKKDSANDEPEPEN